MITQSSIDCIRSVRDQCIRNNVPFFFKQWGGTSAKSGQDKVNEGNKNSLFQEPLTVKSVLGGNLNGISLDRPRVIVDINLIVVSDGKILLAKRRNTGFADGLYSLPAGHLNLGESVISAAVREAKEELGILILPDDVNFVQIMHNSYGLGRLAFFFEIRNWSGDVVNMELHKCEELRWYNPTSLPLDMVPYIRFAIQQYLTDRTLTVFGW